MAAQRHPSGKTFWVFEELRKEYPDIVSRYFKAKRQQGRCRAEIQF